MTLLTRYFYETLTRLRIQNPLEHLRRSFLQKLLTAQSC